MSSTPNQVAKRIKLTNPGNIDDLRGPYADVAAANAAIPDTVVEGESYRKGKFVEIGAAPPYKTYWWRDGYTDLNLVEYFGELLPKLEQKAFILDVSGDNSVVYTILRSIRQWNITAKSISGSFFHIVRVGTEDGLPSIIVNSGAGAGLIKFQRVSEYQGRTNFIGSELNTSGYAGRLTMPTTLSNLIAATNYTSPNPAESPYRMSAANIILLPDSYNKSETLALIAAKPDYNVDAFVYSIPGQNITVFNIMNNGILSYKLYAPETLAGAMLFVGKLGLDSIDSQRCIRLVNGSNVEVIEFKDVKADSISGGWITLIGKPLNASGMSGVMTMSRDKWGAISSQNYIAPVGGGLFVVPHSNIIYKFTPDIPVTSVPKELYLSAPANLGNPDRLPVTFAKLNKFESDFTVIIAGDSLSGRSTNNTQFSDPEYRPPLCSGKNFGSAIWDKIKRGSEKFWRFDALYSGSPRFTESGSFVTITPNQNNVPSNGIDSSVWDDYIRHEAITRRFKGTGTASVTFKMIDTSADKEGSLDFIYRTTLDGCDVCTVTVAEGNGRAVVLDEATQIWVELNGYIFSMKHPPVSTYRGNTKFNARLRIKAVTNTFDSRNLPKTITITKTDTSDCGFMYWGIQTSIERYMVRMINSARGGLDLVTLNPFTDDDIWDHNPDLIIHEIPINGGINIPGGEFTPQHFVDQWNEWMFADTNPRSLREKSKVGGLPWKKFEVIVWSPYCGFATYQDENTFKTQKYADGNWWGPMDNRRQISLLMNQKKENGFAYVDVAQRLPLWSLAIYGNKRQGLAQSSITSEASFIMDDIHPNDLGVRLIARDVFSALDFNP